MAWFLLATAIACNTAANVLLKEAGRGDGNDGLALYLSMPFLAGIVLFAVNLLAYAHALKTIPLAMGYPILVGCTMTGVTVLAIWLFAEPLRPAHYAGIALVAAGVGLLSVNAG